MTDHANPTSGSDRRHFSRIEFQATTHLSQGDKVWETELVDLSLKGILVTTPDPWDADTDLPFASTITLDNGSLIIMALAWRHTEGGRSGFVCQHIDIDSITHLRKLVELNLGDVNLLERELAALGS